MSFATKHNKSGRAFIVDTTGWKDYYGLDDLVEQNGIDAVYPVLGFYINDKGKFGERPVIISDGFFVNAPAHMLSDVKAIIADADDVKDVNEGRVAFKVRSYHSEKYNRDCYGVDFVDCEK